MKTKNNTVKRSLVYIDFVGCPGVILYGPLVAGVSWCDDYVTFNINLEDRRQNNYLEFPSIMATLIKTYEVWTFNKRKINRQYLYVLMWNSCRTYKKCVLRKKRLLVELRVSIYRYRGVDSSSTLSLCFTLHSYRMFVINWIKS